MRDNKKLFIDAYIRGLTSNKSEKERMLKEVYGGKSGTRTVLLFINIIMLMFVLYIAYTGPKLNIFGLLLIRFWAFMMVIGTFISLLLYINTGRNLQKNEQNAVMNVLGIKTTYVEKIIQDLLMVVGTVLLLIIAVKGNKANKVVFHSYGVTGVIGFLYSLYLFYLS